MPKANALIDDILRGAVARAMRTILPAVRRQIAVSTAEGLARRGAAGRGRKRRARPRPDITRWVADRRARRVPNFVVEMTGGLDTKKKIVARYGEGAAFEKGKPLPAAGTPARRNAPVREVVAARVVKAKPPVVRKAAAP